MKKKVLLFARSFLAKYYGDIKSDIIEPIFVTMTTQEREYLENKGWRVYGCFEEEYETLPTADYPSNYLKTSFYSDRFLNRFPYEKRLEILGKEISFWRRIYDETEPAALFNETVAIEIAEVMAIEAEKRGIPFYSALLGFLPNTFYWKPDPFSGRLQNLHNIVPDNKNLELATEYINNVTNKAQVPFYVQSNLGKNPKSFIRFIRSLVSGTSHFLSEKYRQYKSVFRYEDYSKYSYTYTKYYLRSIFYKYDTLSSIIDKPYVYLPLHVEPEATLSYFVNEDYRQDFLIDSIIKSLRQGQYLVVKEHPQQYGLLLEPRFRFLRKQYSNLIYLPSNIPSYDILKSCECIVTLTSTAAWEGLLFKKPALVLGEIYYDQCPGAIRINDLKELKKKLRTSSFPIIQEDEIRLFVARMISIFHSGCPTPGAPDTGINDYVKAMEELITTNKL